MGGAGADGRRRCPTAACDRSSQLTAPMDCNDTRSHRQGDLLTKLEFAVEVDVELQRLYQSISCSAPATAMERFEISQSESARLDCGGIQNLLTTIATAEESNKETSSLSRHTRVEADRVEQGERRRLIQAGPAEYSLESSPRSE
ncbi:hypothetical protein THAOC_17067 [Thalassiosira oceanica]|uniref:Uncharacterized protein n=1 Tax=Thalassiosira oceanica TaxID=159749 RepID=K0SBL0_THAOC|nr:hypothetical protein THAOC_17067 [Thalassiosira oceanica]|eukprot:EJK62324.1 hypothetical protein THAOC_17067 [Thalassiosira oceanica]